MKSLVGSAPTRRFALICSSTETRVSRGKDASGHAHRTTSSKCVAAPPEICRCAGERKATNSRRIRRVVVSLVLRAHSASLVGAKQRRDREGSPWALQSEGREIRGRYSRIPPLDPFASRAIRDRQAHSWLDIHACRCAPRISSTKSVDKSVHKMSPDALSGTSSNGFYSPVKI